MSRMSKLGCMSRMSKIGCMSRMLVCMSRMHISRMYIFSDDNFLDLSFVHVSDVHFSDVYFSDPNVVAFSDVYLSDPNTVAFSDQEVKLRIKKSNYPRGMKMTSERDEDEQNTNKNPKFHPKIPIFAQNSTNLISICL